MICRMVTVLPFDTRKEDLQAALYQFEGGGFRISWRKNRSIAGNIFTALSTWRPRLPHNRRAGLAV